MKPFRKRVPISITTLLTPVFLNSFDPEFQMTSFFLKIYFVICSTFSCYTEFIYL